MLFSALEYKHGEEGIHFYTVEEVKGNDTTVTYDKMVAKVTVLVAKGGNVMTVTSKLPEDTEFNNIVTPPTPPTPVVPPVTPPTSPEVSREQGLPKTGENKSVVAMAFGGLLAAAGLGLAGKRKKED